MSAGQGREASSVMANRKQGKSRVQPGQRTKPNFISMTTKKTQASSNGQRTGQGPNRPGTVPANLCPRGLPTGTVPIDLGDSAHRSRGQCPPISVPAIWTGSESSPSVFPVLLTRCRERRESASRVNSSFHGGSEQSHQNLRPLYPTTPSK